MDELMSKLTVLSRTVDILDGMNPGILNECQNLVKSLDSVKQVIAERSNELIRLKTEMKEQENILKKIEMTHAYLDYMEENMPVQVTSKNTQNIETEIIENGRNNFANNVSFLGNQVNERRNDQEFKENNKFKPAIQTEVSPPPAYWDKAMVTPKLTAAGSKLAEESQYTTPKPRRDLDISISYLTNVELNSVPSYMRGRITLDHVNAFIDVFNTVVSQKYAILRKPKNFYKVKKDLDQYVEWRSQETADLKGHYFCTSKDLSTFGGKKLGTRENNIIIILRHVKRIREVRNKKLVFYVACL